MAAIELAQGENGRTFMKRLLSGEMIEIKLSKTYLPTIRVHGALACAVSKRFEELCKDTRQRSFNADDILPMAHWDHSIWSGFVEWLYATKVPANDSLPYFRMWTMAVRIQAPRLMNRMLELLSSQCAHVADTTTDPELYFAQSYTIFSNCHSIWYAADFSPDRKAALQVTKGEVFWGNKKHLLFMLDCAAWLGLKDFEVQYKHSTKAQERLVSTSSCLPVACFWLQPGKSLVLLEPSPTYTDT
ncbi:hypothetical protein BKA65DRAFT_558390 [Rhexocercosporidium sp. MPI-PUGE-AT-0058]|nr:hypothetical protein BKA65DRAFT_558390 [Rhexocercosporidium sp. MPI-PUGE-AT-0058]